MSSLSVRVGEPLMQFSIWLRRKVDPLEVPFEEEKGKEISQKEMFWEDVRGGSHTLLKEAPFRAASLAQRVAVMVAAPFAFFVGLYRVCRREIGPIDWIVGLSASCSGAFIHFFKELVMALRETGKSIAANIGFFIWHAGEWTVNWIREESTTVLPLERSIRKGVYEGIGTTLLSAVALLMPVAAVQLAALPVFFGSLYGVFHHAFGVQECPEYYTTDHSYEGEELRSHPVRTNHWLVKPIVVGCSAMVGVAKLAGIALAAVGVIPYTAMALPLSWGAVVIGGVYGVAFIIAQIFAAVKKRSIESDLEKYGTLVGGWDANAPWAEVDKREGGDHQTGEKGVLSQRIREEISTRGVPFRLIAAWEANHRRDQMGDRCVKGGALAAVVATLFLRIFAL